MSEIKSGRTKLKLLAACLWFAVFGSNAWGQEPLFSTLDQEAAEQSLTAAELQIEADWDPLILRRNYALLDRDAQVTNRNKLEVELNLFADTSYTAEVSRSTAGGLQIWKGGLIGQL